MPLSKNRLILFIAGLAIVALLATGLGAAAYGILFPPSWTERLPFTNSTGQYDIIVVYRNASDDTYANITGFIDSTSTSIEESGLADQQYRCVEYAVALHDLAQRQGINCTVLGTGTGRETPGHAFVAFRATDGGMIFVDPSARNVSASDYPGVDFSKMVLLRDEWNLSLPCRDAAGISPSVAEHRDASPVTYQQLMAFLAGDRTEDKPYLFPEYTCLDFASLLHDRAEAEGVKCGIVTVSFKGQLQGHAFNAFPTTDKGIVYVDCTGINQTDLADGATPTDNVVYLENGSELGELPVTQVDGNLDYQFYTDRKEKIDAYRARWKQYAADVATYNAEVADHDSQLLANEQYYNSYRSHCNDYLAALEEFNRQMGLHNDAVMANDPSPPPAPANRAELEAWRATLDSEYSHYEAAWSRLESWRQQLNGKKAVLDSRLRELKNAEESKWITFSPMGIVEDIETYWG